MVHAEQDGGSRPPVDQAIRQKAEVLALVMSEDFGMTVGVGEPGSGWSWNFASNHVNIDPTDLVEGKEDIAKGSAVHEAGHRLVSRPEHVQDLWQQPGFAYGLNAVEDPRINQAQMTFRPGVKDWIRSYIEADLATGGGLDYHSISKDTESALGYVPGYMQWGAEMIRHWYEQEFTDAGRTPEARQSFLDKIPDEKVRATVDKTLDFFDTYYTTLPTTKDEGDVQWKAKEASMNFRDNIWPPYKELVEQSYEDHSVVKMIQDMLEQNQQGNQQGQGQQGAGSQSLSIPFSSLPQEIQDEIKEKLSEKPKQGDNSQDERSQSEGSESDGSEGESNGSQNDQDQQGSDGMGQMGSESGSELQDSQEQSAADSGSQSGGKKIPWDKLSNEARDAARNAFTQLEDSEKERYREEAKKDLENSEDNANEKLRGKMGDPSNTKTHKEQREADKNSGDGQTGSGQGSEEQENDGMSGEEKEAQQQEQERQRRENEQRQRKMIEDMNKRRQEAMNDMQESSYYKYLRDPKVQRILRASERTFKNLFEPTEDPDVRYSSYGLRPSLKKAMQAEADPRITNIFESKGQPKEKSYRFMTLIDLSGSMDYGKREQIFMTVIVLSELLSRFGIENCVAGYTDFPNTIHIFKNFEDVRLNNTMREKLGMLLFEGGGGTPTLEASKKAAQLLEKRNNEVPIQHNFLTTFTDGVPSDASAEQIKNFTSKLRKDKSFLSSGFGIGRGSEFVNDSYPELPARVKQDIARALRKDIGKVDCYFEDAEEFAVAFGIIINNMIQHPDMFSGK